VTRPRQSRSGAAGLKGTAGGQVPAKCEWRQREQLRTEPAGAAIERADFARERRATSRSETGRRRLVGWRAARWAEVGERAARLSLAERAAAEQQQQETQQ